MDDSNKRSSTARLLTVAVLALMGGGCLDDDFGRDLGEDERIIGGGATDIRTVPWQVSLRKWGGHFCGGMILSPKWILSAAHCQNFDGVWAGTANKHEAPQKVEIANKYIHPDYGANYVNDVMLVELETPLALDGETTRAITLATECDADEYAPGRDAIVSGWGQTLPGSSTSMANTLQSVVVSMVSDDDAKGAYGGYYQPDNMIAAAADGKDACQGDSGGPLVVGWTDDPLLIGIVSWGHGCASETHPGVYARVPNFIEWIDEVTGGVQHGSCNGQDGVDPGSDPEPEPDPPQPDSDPEPEPEPLPPAGDGECCSSNYTPGCENAAIQACVCDHDDFCCDSSWDDQCANGVESYGCGTCGGDGGGGGGGNGGEECFCDPQCHDFGDCCDQCCGHIPC